MHFQIVTYDDINKWLHGYEVLATSSFSASAYKGGWSVVARPLIFSPAVYDPCRDCRPTLHYKVVGADHVFNV